MPLTVFCCCTYRTIRRDWTWRDWSACWFIKALKHKPINGYAHVPLPHDRRAFLDRTTSANAPTWFAEIAAARIDWSHVGPVAFVPIPDSCCGIDEPAVPRTLRMATALVIRLGDNTSTADILRWTAAMPSSHRAGGTRDPSVLYNRLTLISGVPQEKQLMLVDDVLASGGHLRAAAAFLQDHGGHVVGAICGGRADNEVLDEDAFAARVELLPDLERASPEVEARLA
jgi:hypothetical protein